MELIYKILKIIDWIKVKIRIEISNTSLFPYKKEIWWACLGQNIGVEMNGKHENFERPVLVIHVFNTYSLLVAPITSTENKHIYCIPMVNPSEELNTIVISQIRTISTKRLLRKAGVVDDKTFTTTIQAITSLIIKSDRSFQNPA
jgi:mRNA interferase MazF